MAIVWQGGLATGRRNDRSDPAHKGRWRRLAWWIGIAFLVVVLLAVGWVVALRFSLDRDFGTFFPLGPRFAYDLESGGWAANAAGSVAAKQRVPLVNLSVTTLSVDSPRYEWVDGATGAPYSSAGRPVAGISVSGTHLVTAVQAISGTCSFGLTVTSTSDRLIETDNLPGPGTYYQFDVGPQCIADQPPTTSWSVWIKDSAGHR